MNTSMENFYLADDEDGTEVDPQELEDMEDDELDADEVEQQARVSEGLSCMECGIDFVEAHGEPVLCTSCWDAPNSDHEGVKRATHELA